MHKLTIDKLVINRPKFLTEISLKYDDLGSICNDQMFNLKRSEIY